MERGAGGEDDDGQRIDELAVFVHDDDVRERLSGGVGRRRGEGADLADAELGSAPARDVRGIREELGELLGGLVDMAVARGGDEDAGGEGGRGGGGGGGVREEGREEGLRLEGFGLRGLLLLTLRKNTGFSGLRRLRLRRRGLLATAAVITAVVATVVVAVGLLLLLALGGLGGDGLWLSAARNCALDPLVPDPLALKCGRDILLYTDLAQGGVVLLGTFALEAVGALLGGKSRLETHIVGLAVQFVWN